MKKLDELGNKLKTAIEAQKSGIQNEIRNLQSQVDSKSSELRDTLLQLGGGILIYGLVFWLLWAMGNAWANVMTFPEGLLGPLSVLAVVFVMFPVGVVLVIVTIVVISTSISKGIEISTLKSEISNRDKIIRKLDNDLRKLR